MNHRCNAELGCHCKKGRNAENPPSQVPGTQGLPKTEAKPGREGTPFTKSSLEHQAIAIYSWGCGKSVERSLLCGVGMWQLRWSLDTEKNCLVLQSPTKHKAIASHYQRSLKLALKLVHWSETRYSSLFD